MAPYKSAFFIHVVGVHYCGCAGMLWYRRRRCCWRSLDWRISTVLSSCSRQCPSTSKPFFTFAMSVSYLTSRACMVYAASVRHAVSSWTTTLPTSYRAKASSPSHRCLQAISHTIDAVVCLSCLCILFKWQKILTQFLFAYDSPMSPRSC